MYDNFWQILHILALLGVTEPICNHKFHTLNIPECGYWTYTEFLSKIVPLNWFPGADVNMPNSAGRTPLHIAICTGGGSRADTVSVLLDGGADPNRGDSAGLTPLHCAGTKFNRIKWV